MTIPRRNQINKNAFLFNHQIEEARKNKVRENQFFILAQDKEVFPEALWIPLQASS